MSKIDEVLLNGIKAYEGGDKLVFSLDPIKLQLLELLESCKPEEKTKTLRNRARSGTDYVMYPQDTGYNKALNEYHSNIRKLFDEVA